MIYQEPANQRFTRSAVLQEVISATNVSDLSGLEFLQLAFLLAKAVFRFHASPWMLENWRSENVRFYGVDSSNVQRPGLSKASFLNFKIPGPYKATQAVSSNDPLSPVRDHILFGLGIILLRLYFEPPLKEFHGARDKEKRTKRADFLAAGRLNTTIGSTLGSRYGKEVSELRIQRS